MTPSTDTEIKTFFINKALATFDKLHPLGQGLHNAMHQYCRLIRLKNGEDLLKQGDFCKSFYFVCDGLLISENTQNNKKIITWFCKSGDSATSISGLYGTVPSQERIYAYGDALLLVLDTVYLEYWYEEYPEINVVMRKIFEYYFQMAQERAIVLRMGTAYEKYEYYKKSHSDYVNIVPLELIASYLGMKQSTLEFIIKNEEMQVKKALDIEKSYQKLLHCMEIEKVYLQNSLTLKALAKKLKQTPHHLSGIINTKSGKNFNDFVNTYRVAYVQERCRNRDEWKHLKLETLGIEAGFKSRSSFFSVFKKQVGLSPALFIDSKTSK